MANRIMLNQTSYHGSGAIMEIANEAVEVPANDDVSEVTVGSEKDAKCDITDDEEPAEVEEEKTAAEE